MNVPALDSDNIPPMEKLTMFRDLAMDLGMDQLALVVIFRSSY